LYLTGAGIVEVVRACRHRRGRWVYPGGRGDRIVVRGSWGIPQDVCGLVVRRVLACHKVVCPSRSDSGSRR
jgi:hypothetical protein